MSHWSGTSYEGPLKNEWYEGEGKFHFPNGVTYIGQFRKGEFHGEGALVYPNGCRYIAEWYRGYAVTGRCEFADGLGYQDKGWKYLTKTDRKFYTEVLHGLKPAGATLLTNSSPTPEVPVGTYDAGHGFFDPLTGKILSYDGADVVDTPDAEEAAWIEKYCRKGFPVPRDPDADLERGLVRPDGSVMTEEELEIHLEKKRESQKKKREKEEQELEAAEKGKAGEGASSASSSSDSAEAAPEPQEGGGASEGGAAAGGETALAPVAEEEDEVEEEEEKETEKGGES
uniref:MORN repeat-containing protein 5 n=1 Tax=Chromera velia CCMP2878 TaxID=1169474 RepID=A0A0G4GFC5_9ALVE|eukprot:Cvel_4606.t1-p1 / transcript=Cvel_4606.t1 / gene=Cvel_4606 / organism=Chromera_velia_CCMP2878 / gene_product=MORN repeat-containing protein 5, putative / transcript_product=MORN repeat-containing protein 5, putative / location=Cvel_scaffold202:75728-78527(-) / protein_length=284 / sequence_SO=supercontig / SO=protein_coding / is_pseudo=false